MGRINLQNKIPTMKLSLALISCALAAPHCAPTLSGSPAVAGQKHGHAMGHVDIEAPSAADVKKAERKAARKAEKKAEKKDGKRTRMARRIRRTRRTRKIRRTRRARR